MKGKSDLFTHGPLALHSGGLATSPTTPTPQPGLSAFTHNLEKQKAWEIAKGNCIWSRSPAANGEKSGTLFILVHTATKLTGSFQHARSSPFFCLYFIILLYFANTPSDVVTQKFVIHKQGLNTKSVVRNKIHNHISNQKFNFLCSLHQFSWFPVANWLRCKSEVISFLCDLFSVWW